MSDLMLDVGQANELKLAFRRADWNNDDIKRLCEGNVLVEVRNILRGHASINVIDCDADPFTPEGWTVEEHQKDGQYQFDAAKVSLWLAKDKQSGETLERNKLRKEMRGKPVLNANVLDYLLTNPHLIPEEWKDKYVFFWGTVYYHRDGSSRFVRYLYWLHDRWGWDGYGLDVGWFASGPAALRMS